MFVLFTPTEYNPQEVLRYNALFEKGLHALVIRYKPSSADSASGNVSESDKATERAYHRNSYVATILAIDPKYRSRVLLDDHFDLLEKSDVGGAYLNRLKWPLYNKVKKQTQRIATSVHSLEELAELPFEPTFAFLSPVFDSISKEGYRGAISLEACHKVLPTIPFPVVALGGITPQRSKEALANGFEGVAALGFLQRQSGEEMLRRFLQFPQPKVLALGGHDPSTGAGITADVETISLLGGYPLSIPTALTIQHEDKFEQILPVDERDVRKMVGFLLKRHRIYVAKVGLCSSLTTCLEAVRSLQRGGVKRIVWDPVIKASMGDTLFWQAETDLIAEIARYITLITPNQEEAKLLFGDDTDETLLKQSQLLACAILLKGIRVSASYITDILYLPNGEKYLLPIPSGGSEKHGSGCTLSAVIATRLAQGYPLLMACRMGQQYVDGLRRSSPQLLADRRWEAFTQKRAQLSLSYVQFITCETSSEQILADAKCFLDAGGRWIQLRMKKATHAERVQTAKKLKELCRSYDNAVLIINDDVMATLKSDADGVHLGLSDCTITEARRILGDGRIIGGTCNTADDIRQRALEGADYIGVGPVRYTETKENLSPTLGVEGIRRCYDVSLQLPHPLPLVAIGGIVREDATSLSTLGIAGVAISGEIKRYIVQNKPLEELINAFRQER